MAKVSVKKQPIMVFDTETTGVNPHLCKLLGISSCDGGKGSYDSFNPDYIEELTPHGFNLVGQNIKYDMVVLDRHGIKLPDAYFDTIIAHYLLYINESHKLENIVKQLFGVHKADLVETYCKSTGKERKTLPDKFYEEIKTDDLASYAIEDAEWTYKLYERLSAELDKQPILRNWFYNVEMQVLNILVKTELKGVKVDRQGLTALRDELNDQLPAIEKRLRHLAGDSEFNLNSSKQLRELLYKKFKLPILSKTDKGEPSTDKDTMQQLAKQCEHAFPTLLLRHREYSKILSTYTDSLMEKLDSNDRLHTVYNQALTNTRRFSSQDPNLQNIPTRSPLGKRIKGCFIPEAGHKFLIADYSQLEPRILAHLSEDEFLIDCFKNGKDIYENTASIVRKSGFGEFSRDKSKILFLALMYGKSSYGLAQDWHCQEKEAEAIVQSVFKELAGVRRYIDAIQERAFQTSGWLTSLAGLPLYVGDPHSNNKWEGMAVDRCAVNYPIQASSQDILKMAMVQIYKNLNLYPVLMVHDELVFELPIKQSMDKIHNAIIDEMENCWKLKVPLKVEYKLAERWEK